jgi:hypothetical protein
MGFRNRCRMFDSSGRRSFLIAGNQLHEISVRVSDERDPQFRLGCVSGRQNRAATRLHTSSLSRRWRAAPSVRGIATPVAPLCPAWCVGAPAATVGTPYSFALGAPDVGPGRWSLRAGTLPDGLLLDPAGTLSGIPTTAGSFPLTLSLTDGAGHETRRLEFALTVYPRFAVVSKRFPPLRVGRAFSARVTTEGAVGPVTYKVVAGRFPIGVRLDASTGVVRGKARKVGVYVLTIRATDSLGRIASGLEILTIRERRQTS